MRYLPVTAVHVASFMARGILHEQTICTATDMVFITERLSPDKGILYSVDYSGYVLDKDNRPYGKISMSPDQTWYWQENDNSPWIRGDHRFRVCIDAEPSIFKQLLER